MQFNEKKDQIMVNSLPDLFKNYIKEVNVYNHLKENYSQATSKTSRYYFFKF